MATALVTGGTGFVGSWVARTLVEAGHDVHILRRETSRLDAVQDLPVTHHVATLDDRDGLRRAMDGMEWVFHVAAISAYWRNNREKIYQVNVDGTRNALQAAEQAGVQRFVFTSSAAAIGWRADNYPTDESTYFNIDPALSPYAHSKFLAEVEVHRAIQRGLDAVIVNPTVILGPRDLNQISGSLIIEIARGQVPVMPLQGGVTVIDVRDVAQAHLAAAQKGETGQRYILGTVNMSHRALMALIAQIVDVPPPSIPAPGVVVDVAAWLVDIARALNIDVPGDAEGGQLRMSKRNIFFDCARMWNTLHEPQIDIYESILDTYQWYQKQGIV